MAFEVSASLECGGLAPLCYRSRPIKDQSGARPPHSKEALTQTARPLGSDLANGDFLMKLTAKKIVRHSKKTGHPVTQDRTQAIEGIRRGLQSMKRNAGKPAEEFSVIFP